MKNNTILYGLLAIGGLYVYYAWKKNNTSLKDDSNTESTSSLGDVSAITEGTGGIKPSRPIKQLTADVKNTVSQIAEPFIGTEKQKELIAELSER